MKQQQIAGIIGGLMALSLLIFQVYHSFQSMDSVFRELMISVQVFVPLVVPAIVLHLNMIRKKDYTWVVWLYPVILGIGVFNIFVANDALAAGIPMIFVEPFCIVFAILLFTKLMVKKDRK